MTIKGTQKGLVFNLNDNCAYDDLLMELREKLQDHPHLHNGPMMNVSVHLGYRYLNEEQCEELRELIRSEGNMKVEKIESLVALKEEVEQARAEAGLTIIYKTVRSGQVVKAPGDMLVVGDINPGAHVQAGGHIFVLGALRGLAHAGANGNYGAIIAAAELCSTQLRIASVVNQPPDTVETLDKEFAYIRDDRIVVEKLHRLARLRPELQALSTAIDQSR